MTNDPTIDTAEWERFTAAKLREGICPDTGLPLRPEGNGVQGSMSCAACDCFGYSPDEVGPKPKSPLTLTERLVFAALSVLRDEDPVINMAVGKNELNITWTQPEESTNEQ